LTSIVRINGSRRLRPGVFALVALMFAATLAAPAARAQFAPTFQISAPYVILMDYASGTVLFEKKADTPWPPASLAKLMTMEIVFNEIKRGDIKLDEELVVSANAWRKGGAPSRGSAMFASIHSKVKVVDLIQGVIVQSGNDASIVFAEALAGNEDLFARLMNERARELGLTSADFRNSTGLYDPDQTISVRDLAKLAAHLIRAYPEFFPYYSQREFTWNKIRQLNRNPLLDMNIGADGMKTGFTKESGYGLVGTAVQNGQRLIVVVNGVHDQKVRGEEAKKLLEWGFRNFEARLLFKDGATVAEARVFGGERGHVPLIGAGPIHLLTPRSAGDKILARVYYSGPLRAPIKKGAESGRLKVFRGDKVVLEQPLYTGADVGQGSLIQRAIDVTSETALGWVRSAMSSVLKR
jgi:D-alanyl-D-alanine carboxypeptidase (penicillin-binding protein 5/6)